MSGVTRRDAMIGGGVTVLFAIAHPALAQALKAKQTQDRRLPGDLAKYPYLDSWIRIAPDGRATVFTGKAELGQGLKTALLQIAADELDVKPGAITLITADTARTPDEGFTAGSHSMQDSGTALANAAANLRMLLADAAARRWNVPLDSLKTGHGIVQAADGRTLEYGALAAELDLTVEARPGVPRKRPDQLHLIGKPVRRVDIPAKLTGGSAYIHDMRPPGMLHGRVLRGPSYGTRLATIDGARIGALRGVEHVIRKGDFAAILGPREWPLMQALRVIAQAPWQPTRRRPAGAIADWLIAAPGTIRTDLSQRLAPEAKPVRQLSARYSRPYLLHGSIGPSCAVAIAGHGGLAVWTHSQGVSPLREALAELCDLPLDKVHCIHVEGAGCYGHNGADDVAADAALAALAVPGRPVKMLWTREQEHGWEPMGPAMVAELRGAIDVAGRIVDWRHDVWSNTHSTRPAAAGDLLAGQETGFTPTSPKPLGLPEGGGDRNAVPLYDLPNIVVADHFVPAMPQRVSALRSLGAHLNVFALESFIDELAAAARRDPVAFRLAHLSDPRAVDIVRRATSRFGWATYRPRPNSGRGFAFARYKNLGAYCAIAMEVTVDADRGRLLIGRVVAAVDSGEAVNPDGIRNQIEGGIVQSLSWTSLEQATYGQNRRTTFDWSSYPILRFDSVPLSIEIDVIDRPGLPFLGTGEAAQGPAAAAFANAVASATGHRSRDMPIMPFSRA